MDSITVKTKKHYEEITMKYGDSPKSCDWERKDAQIFRWNKLLDISGLRNYDMKGNSKIDICDFGCGIGDFYGYLENQKINIDYTGIDIAENMIELAKKKYPKGTFYAKDILHESVNGKFDFIFMNGIFNIKLEENDVLNRENMYAILKNVFQYAEVGMAFNFISEYVNWKDDEMVYFNPMKVLEWCIENLSRKVKIEHHYEKCDVCVYVLK